MRLRLNIPSQSMLTFVYDVAGATDSCCRFSLFFRAASGSKMPHRFESVDAAEKCIDTLRKYRNLHPSFSKVAFILIM